MSEDKIKCPRCMSDQVTADKKGFSGKNALGGVLLTGGVGILAGTIGSNKIIITCLACGKTFKPGEGYKEVTYQPQKPPVVLSSQQKDERIRNTIWAFLGFIVGAVWVGKYTAEQGWWGIFAVPAFLLSGAIFAGIFAGISALTQDKLKSIRLQKKVRENMQKARKNTLE
jgi:hypothetical protein